MTSKAIHCLHVHALGILILGGLLAASVPSLAKENDPNCAKDPASCIDGGADANSIKAPQIYIVVFSQPGAMHYQGDILGLAAAIPETLGKNGAKHYDINAPQVIAYRKYLAQLKEKQLDGIANKIGHAPKIHHAYDLIFFGLALELTANEASLIRALPNIADIRAERIYPLGTFRSPGFMGAEDIWHGISVPFYEPILPGAGVTIAVIDSGYNSSHPSFADTSCHFPPHKVLSAVDCTRDTGSDLACLDIAHGGNPEDTNGHGTHTASTAGGNALPGGGALPAPVIPAGYPYISGIAPCANLRIYKACDGDGRGSGCTATDIMAAQQQALADGVNVISYSGGGGEMGESWSGSDIDSGFLDAVRVGITVATGAGNTGYGTPMWHRAPWVLTAAASSSDSPSVHVASGTLSATGPGAPPLNTTNLVLFPNLDKRSQITSGAYALSYYPGNAQGCSGGGGFPAGYFSDALALIARGGCSFQEKATNAATAGARAVVLYNTSDNFLLHAAVDEASIPMNAITLSDGNALVSYLSSHGNRIAITVSGSPGGVQGDVLADFSLRGPNTSFDVTKPDISAPGINVYAAMSRTSDATPPHPASFGYLDGTSVATPHTAGAMALVLSVHPDWSPAEVMSALRMTAVHNGTKEDGRTPWTPDDVGNGRVDLSKAAMAGLVMHETYANFGAANPDLGGDPKTLNLPALRNTNCVTSCRFTRTVRNTLNYPATWAVSTSSIPGVATLAVSPTTFTIAPQGLPGDTQILTITATADPLLTSLSPLGFSSILLHSDTSDWHGNNPPDEHITVAVQAAAH